MDRSVLIALVSETFAPNEYGVEIPTETKREVYAQVQNVSLDEWSNGGRLGLNPSLRFTMFAPDYNEEEIIEYEGNRYTVYRTYIKRNDYIDLYTERRQGNVQSRSGSL